MRINPARYDRLRRLTGDERAALLPKSPPPSRLAKHALRRHSTASLNSDERWRRQCWAYAHPVAGAAMYAVGGALFGIGMGLTAYWFDSPLEDSPEPSGPSNLQVAIIIVVVAVLVGLYCYSVVASKMRRVDELLAEQSSTENINSSADT